MKTLITILLVFVSGHPFAQSAGVKNILLIHGTFADGSGWEGVFKILTSKGYHVTIVQNPCSSLEDDVATVRRAMDRETGPCILVGHSYGGSVITEAGSDARVVGLVYVDGFVPGLRRERCHKRPLHPGPDQWRHPAAGCIGPSLYG